MTDDKASMSDIKLMSNSTIYLKEASIEVDEEEEAETEFGFSGTKLHLSSRTLAEAKEEIQSEPGMILPQSSVVLPSESDEKAEMHLEEDDVKMSSPKDEHPDDSMNIDPDPSSNEPVNSCPACTYINETGAEKCEICYTVL